MTWAPWNFDGSGQKWPTKTFKEALIEAPPGLYGGQRSKKAKKAKPPAIHKALKEHWDQLPAALKEKCQAMGVVEVEAPATPDLPTLIKEHLSSLPTDLKEAVEKLVAPSQPEPPLASKVKQAVGTLKQLTEKKAAIQAKADAVKTQYTQLLQDLKELQTKIESAQKDLQTTTSQYNQQLENQKQEDAEMADELSPEALVTAMASVGLQATSAQVKDLAVKLGETAAKRRKCG